MLYSPYVASAPGIVQQRLAKALRFRRLPGKFRRANLRNRPFPENGPFENPVKRFVRLREKSRIFSIIPPAKVIPCAKSVHFKYLKSVSNVPKVSPDILERRLTFLLSEKAVKQQLYAKLRPGLTPYQVENEVWIRQMQEIRRIYRAQYLQKLAVVTNEERLRQIREMRELYLSKQRLEQKRQTELYEARRRKALLKDHAKLKEKIYESAQIVKRGRKMSRFLRLMQYIENHSDYITPENAEKKILNNSNLFDRPVSVPKLLQQLNLSSDEDLVAPYVEGRSIDVHKQIFRDSFRYLPEDADSQGKTYRQEVATGSILRDEEKAAVSYRKFTESEKLKLLDEKILLTQKRLEDSDYLLSRGGTLGHNDHEIWVHLLDQLEATKAAHLAKIENMKDNGHKSKRPFDKKVPSSH